jgi:hypothetical protein
VLTRAMKKITAIAGAVGTKLRDRSRSVKCHPIAAPADQARAQERRRCGGVARRHSEAVATFRRKIGCLEDGGRRAAKQIPPGIAGGICD